MQHCTVDIILYSWDVDQVYTFLLSVVYLAVPVVLTSRDGKLYQYCILNIL